MTSHASDFNPFLPAVKANPYPHYAVLRETAPVQRIELLNAYAISRHEDVVYVLKNPDLFSNSSEIMKRYISQDDPNPERKRMRGRKGLLSTDPPVHTRLRGLVSRAFTASHVAALEPRIRALACSFIDAALKKGEFDLLADLATPLPVIVIAELLGVEPERRDDFKRWSDDLIASSTVQMRGGDMTRIDQSFKELFEYLDRKIEERRREPRSDLISELIRAGEREDVLTPEDVHSFAILLLVAGNETTTNLLGNGMLALLTHPDQLARLRAQPALIPTAVEEMLRFDSPVQSMFRGVTQEVRIAGVTLPKGATVMPLIGSANRDERKYKDADHFDIARDVPGVSFGHGIHFCLGAPLARLEAKVTLEELFSRTRELALATEPERIEWADAGLMRGLKRLPLRAQGR